MAERAERNGGSPPGPEGEGRHLPVLAGSAESAIDAPLARPIARPEPAPVPAPVAAVATGGFLAGVASYLLLRGLRTRGRRRTIRLGGGRRGRSLEVEGSRSFLVNVHVLKR